jgi:hypothetical protein
MPPPVRDFASVIMAAIDGLAIRSLVEPETDLAALYRALGFLLLSSMMSELRHGQPASAAFRPGGRAAWHPRFVRDLFPRRR